MIELIFVIVILGILASVAIPRLAGTRTDAEVATAVANLRTILSDASGYYVAHGSFGTITWKTLTNVPLESATNQAASNGAAATAHLKVGEATDCIGIQVVEKDPTTKRPAHIKFYPKQKTTGSVTATTTDGVCGQVLAAEPIRALVINSAVNYTDASNQAQTLSNAIAIGSTTSVY
ncbi:type II secretion system protein [Campylobacter magnus]|uniref:type II secretion system protein n=1 Tax=Campylobacter magnus TaxID=3026462 RepID=UPI003B631F50